MHIAEGFLPSAHAVAWTAVAAPFVIHGAREAIRTVRQTPEAGVLLGVAGAFTFVMSAIKLPSVTGSSSHPTGTGLGTIIFRPPVMAFVATVVLIFQALLLAHGGLTTLGANVFSMGIAGPTAQGRAASSRARTGRRKEPSARSLPAMSRGSSRFCPSCRGRSNRECSPCKPGSAAGSWDTDSASCGHAADSSATRRRRRPQARPGTR